MNVAHIQLWHGGSNFYPQSQNLWTVYTYDDHTGELAEVRVLAPKRATAGQVRRWFNQTIIVDDDNGWRVLYVAPA